MPPSTTARHPAVPPKTQLGVAHPSVPRHTDGAHEQDQARHQTGDHIGKLNDEWPACGRHPKRRSTPRSRCMPARQHLRTLPQLPHRRQPPRQCPGVVAKPAAATYARQPARPGPAASGRSASAEPSSGPTPWWTTTRSKILLLSAFDALRVLTSQFVRYLPPRSDVDLAFHIGQAFQATRSK